MSLLTQFDEHLFGRAKGTYILILRKVSPSSLTIGRLGTFDFPVGWYAYVGSAFGAGGLGGRLKHHLLPVKRPHWHIDYLRQAASTEEVWYVVSQNSHEHTWASTLRSMSSATVPALRFGASDCTCQTHLIGYASKPDFQTFRKLAQAEKRVERFIINQDP